MTPIRFNRISACSSIRIFEMERMIDCQLLIVSLIQPLICPPTIRDHQGFRLDPYFNKTEKCPSCSIWDQNYKATSRLVLNPTKNPLSVNKMIPLKLPLPNFGLVNFRQFFPAPRPSPNGSQHNRPIRRWHTVGSQQRHAEKHRDLDEWIQT